MPRAIIGGERSPVVVTIGYGVGSNGLRSHDLTLPVRPEYRAPRWLGPTPDNAGGVDPFLKIIETEIKPRIFAELPINTADQTIFGHSLVGLAVIRALFTEPTAFHTYIAASP